MRVLVVGPGVIGTVVASRLARSGHDVTVFGRGTRLRAVERHGLRLFNGPARVPERTRVATTDRLDGPTPELVVVAVRAHQWVDLMPRVGALGAPRVLTLVNHGASLDAWVAALGPALIPGFPGISGAFDDDVVTYALAPRVFQPTTIGEPIGPASPRIHLLCETLEAAGLPSRAEDQMEAWLRCHAGWMAPLMAATLACDRDPNVLLHDRALRRHVVGAVRESLGALSAAGVPLVPRALASWRYIPEALLSAALALAAKRPELAGRIRDPGSVRGEAELVIGQLYDVFMAQDQPTPSWNALRARL